MLPAAFKLRPVPGTRDQLRAVRELLRDRRFSEVVNACDAGREGELIFRYVYELAGSRLPIKRLWISSLTDEAIRAGFAGLKPGVELDALAERRALPLGGRLAGGHERHPRGHGELAGRRAAPPLAAPRPRRGAASAERFAAVFDRPRADADAGDPRAARAGDPAVPAARLLGGARRVRARRVAGRGHREGDRHLGCRPARRQGDPLAPRRARAGGRRRRPRRDARAGRRPRRVRWSSGCGKSGCASRRRCCSISRRCSGRPTGATACRRRRRWRPRRRCTSATRSSPTRARTRVT